MSDRLRLSDIGTSSCGSTQLLEDEMINLMALPSTAPAFLHGNQSEAKPSVSGTRRHVLPENAVLHHPQPQAAHQPRRIICSIYKKGDKLECGNYRAVAVLNAAHKVISQIIFRRLLPIVNELVEGYQGGFVDGRSITGQIFTVLQMLQKCRE
ncbi:uncharacterized protein LOC134209179 [Armigeres subalbatus]|uniref:uncharacterized protein LOC134209179 n=1 Tax=Armigeres subalbatus TaxID=124917 RepID=UPI002ED61DF4